MRWTRSVRLFPGAEGRGVRIASNWSIGNEKHHRFSVKHRREKEEELVRKESANFWFPSRIHGQVT